jgi:hypothetical protein
MRSVQLRALHLVDVVVDVVVVEDVVPQADDDTFLIDIV